MTVPHAETPDPARDRFDEDPRGATGAFSPPQEDPKDANDPATLLRMREHFGLSEAVRAISRWDLGVIDRLREFRRGSRRSPKLRIAAETGEYLLKRRAPGRDEAARMAFGHDVLAQLATAGYPVAPLVPTRRGETVALLEGRIYELFRYVESDGFSRAAEAAGAAGSALARLHALLASAPADPRAPTASFHASQAVDVAFAQIPDAIGAVEGDADIEEVRRTCRLLQRGYREAARRCDAAGWSQWRPQIVHGDWHPGNVLFRADRVVAVLDFDSARIEPRAIDLSNGLLQFSMLFGPPEDPLAWPEGFDGRRIERFLRDYDRTLRQEGAEPLAEAERTALPWLMIEALIAETAIPIAATGSFASIRASTFLQMVERKVDWIWRRSSRLVRLVEKTPGRQRQEP